MKIVWVTNVPVSDSPFHGHGLSPFGGWIEAGFLGITATGDHEITVCTPTAVTSVQYGQGRKASHIALPKECTVSQMQDVLRRIRPDLVHIHGTEFPHAATAATAALWNGIPSVTSIQGLLGPYSTSSSFYNGIPAWSRYAFSLSDLFRKRSMALLRRDFVKRSYVESQILGMSHAAIGRTQWDRDCLAAINPALPYFSCNETLRPSFYQASWSRAKAQDFSILLAQGNYPIKGAHLAIEALAIVRDRYPDVSLTIAGQDPTQSARSFSWLRRSAYGTYLIKLVRSHRLEDNVRFVGPLSELDMREAFLESHVSLNASSIENSPNSLGEAMLLGVPTVTPYAGGMPSMASTSTTAFYPAGDQFSLASRIGRIFEDEVYANSLSVAAQKIARRTHDPSLNARKLSQIYEVVARG